MPDFTRRRFLTQVSVTTGVGIAGGLGLHKLLVADDASPQSVPDQPVPARAPAPVTNLDAAKVTLAGPMLVHIRDVATAEVAMMVGTQELVYRDPELVSRLVRTASAGREG